MQLWENPNEENTERGMEKNITQPVFSPCSALKQMESLAVAAKCLFVCVFTGNLRILTVIIVKFITTTIKVAEQQQVAASFDHHQIQICYLRFS